MHGDAHIYYVGDHMYIYDLEMETKLKTETKIQNKIHALLLETGGY